MSEAIPRCPKLQGIATLESAFPFAHVLLLPTVENRLCYITIILPREDDAPKYTGEDNFHENHN
tara:strand:- start:499 stop:690 length:192 start_codon:yes stop_codon:yes gene_type:complete